MNINSKQLLRLIKIVGELKENRYPNCISFSKKLKKMDLDENISLSCSPKTIQRDIKLLKNCFNAPIKFDTERNGFYLAHHGWNFYHPIYSDSEMLASVLGAKIAEDFLPEPLKSEVRKAVDFQLATNNPDFLDTANISSFITSFSKSNIKIPATIFGDLFEAWKNHNSVEIVYESADRKSSTRIIDPYIITFYNGNWYTKAWCHLRKDIRFFALHRIRKIEITQLTYEFDKTVLENYDINNPFNYKLETINNVELVFSKYSAKYIIDRCIANNYKYNYNNNGSVKVYIESASKYEILCWILCEGSNVKIIRPLSLIENIKQHCLEIINQYE
jgi:predicted DNA-binding transcriptional regulator YafY